MNSTDLVKKTIMGENPGRTPIYGWVSANMSDKICAEFGSVAAFEDHYGFDLAHLFGGPSAFGEAMKKLKAEVGQVTPEMLLDFKLGSPDNMEDYAGLAEQLEFHKGQRGRFCYVQTNGFFECYNGPFGIENHLMYLALYPDEIAEIYRRQAEWNMKFAEHCIELGADMIHVSDDWGAQNSLMFSPAMFREFVFPNHKKVADFVKSKGAFVSLHSDGCVASVLDDIVEIGYDVVHPYQENAGMSYDVYIDKYSDKFAILGGVCVQSTLGFGDIERLSSEISRVFSLLKSRRFICCTTHFVQEHCSVEELVAAYDLISELRK